MMRFEFVPTYISEVAIVDQLHQQKHVNEDLAFGNKCDFGGTHNRTMKFLFNILSCLQGSGLTRELEALVKVGKVKLDDEDGVGKRVVFPQLFELFG